MTQKHIAPQGELDVLGMDSSAVHKKVAAVLGVDVLTDLEKDFVSCALAAKEAAVMHLTRYWDLCVATRGAIRGQPMAKVKQVRKILFALGYHKVTVSELIHVSSLPDKDWEPYRAKLIGFKQALNQARMKRGGGLVLEDKIKSSALTFVSRLFNIGEKTKPESGTKKFSVGDYEITVVRKEHKPSPILTGGKKGKK